MFTEFKNLHLPVLRGLVRAVWTDVDVFLLTVAGLALTAFPRPLRGLGVSLLTYVVIRRVDLVAGVFATKLDLLARVMSKLAPPQE